MCEKKHNKFQSLIVFLIMFSYRYQELVQKVIYSRETIIILIF